VSTYSAARVTLRSASISNVIGRKSPRTLLGSVLTVIDLSVMRWGIR
jgi:hypothetical protein